MKKTKFAKKIFEACASNGEMYPWMRAHYVTLDYANLCIVSIHGH